jgi:hypothetical protein
MVRAQQWPHGVLRACAGAVCGGCPPRHRDEGNECAVGRCVWVGGGLPGLVSALGGRSRSDGAAGSLAY